MTARTIAMRVPDSLGTLFAGVLERFSLLEDHHGECSQVTLWFRSRDAGVAVSSEMHDVADRLAVGVLDIKNVYSDPDSSFVAFPKEGTPRIQSLVPALEVKALWKLSISENEAECESGLRLLLSDETELSILPSAFPCHVVPIRNGHSLTKKPTEYKYENYKQERIF